MEMFRSQGIKSVRMDDIAQQLGVSKRTLYELFGDKETLLFVGGLLYLHVPIWATWLVFVAACALSMIVMLSMVKWLERVTKD